MNIGEPWTTQTCTLPRSKNYLVLTRKPKLLARTDNFMLNARSIVRTYPVRTHENGKTAYLHFSAAHHREIQSKAVRKATATTWFPSTLTLVGAVDII